MNTLRIPRALMDELLTHADSGSGYEVCGLIAGNDASASRCFPIDNIAAEPERAFEMDPKQQIEAMRQMREANESLLAIYHTHPTSPTAPSPKDLEDVSYPDALYVIVSLENPEAPQVEAFRLTEDRSVTPAEIVVED